MDEERLKALVVDRLPDLENGLGNVDEKYIKIESERLLKEAVEKIPICLGAIEIIIEWLISLSEDEVFIKLLEEDY